MKSYNHLWEIVISPDNIIKAISKAAKGKRERTRVKLITENVDDFIPYFQNLASIYKHRTKRPKYIYDGMSRKRRKIIVPSFDEQVLHHMIVNALEPVIKKGMYEHVHGSIPGRGPQISKKQIEKWIRKSPKNCKYFLKMDIKNFFGSINHEILEKYIRKYIHDERAINFIHEILSCTDIGLPLGYHTSHWLANWFLQDLDHYIKENLGVVFYSRYMDDMVIFGPNKKKLHEAQRKIEQFLQERKGLTMANKWQVCRFEYSKKGKRYGRDVDFMGFRFHRDRTTLRRSIMMRISRRARRIGGKEKPTIFDCKQMLSALGWIKATNTYNWYLKYVKPFVSFRKCKKRISAYDRRENKRKELLLCG